MKTNILFLVLFLFLIFYHPLYSQVVVNDPDFAKQWYLK